MTDNNAADPEVGDIEVLSTNKIRHSCAFCGKILTEPCDCFSKLPFWKLSRHSAKLLRDEFGFHIPKDIESNAWDDRLFLLELDRKPNPDFLGLKGFKEEMGLLRHIFDTFGEPLMDTKRNIDISDGGNKYRVMVPVGAFKDKECLILKHTQIMKYVNDSPDINQYISDAISPAPPVVI